MRKKELLRQIDRLQRKIKRINDNKYDIFVLLKMGKLRIQKRLAKIIVEIIELTNDNSRQNKIIELQTEQRYLEEMLSKYKEIYSSIDYI